MARPTRVRHLAGTTNADEPFGTGEIVQLSDDHYVVETNDGASGSVLAMGGGTRIAHFRWTYCGELVRRTGRHVWVYALAAA